MSRFRFHSAGPGNGGRGAGGGSPLFGGGNQDSPRSRRSQNSSGHSSNGSGSGRGRGRFPFGFGKRRSTDSPSSSNGTPPKRTPPPSPFDDEHNLRLLANASLGKRQADTLKKVKELYADDEMDPQSYRINQIKILQSHLGSLDYDGLHEAAKNMGTREDIDGVEIDEDGEPFIDVQELRGTLMRWLKNGEFEKLTMALKAPPQSNGVSTSSSGDAEMKYAPPAASSSSSSSSNHRASPKDSPMPSEAENDATMRDVIALLDSSQPDSVQPSTSATSRELELTIHDFLKKQQEARCRLLNTKLDEAYAAELKKASPALESLRVETQRFSLDSKEKVVVPARMALANCSALSLVATIQRTGSGSQHYGCSVTMASQNNTKLVEIYNAELQMSGSPRSESLSPQLKEALGVDAGLSDALLIGVMRVFCRVCVVNLL